jgi:hypothetical protein
MTYNDKVKEFAITYAGCMAVINEYRARYMNGVVGRIIGYDDGESIDDNIVRVVIEIDKTTTNRQGGFRPTDPCVKKIVVDPNTIVGLCWRIPYDNLKIISSPPLKTTQNDDCLDCGAKGNEPCKVGCPNK